MSEPAPARPNDQLEPCGGFFDVIFRRRLHSLQHSSAGALLRSAGEPERFVAGYWDEQVPLDPQWNISIGGLAKGAEPGGKHPGDVFYRATDDGLCVIDVAWSTLIAVG